MRPFFPALLLFLSLALNADPADAQEPCPEGRISHIFVDNHSIFDPASLAPELRFRWAYDAANALHIRTRPSFILSELLVHVGDCLDPEKVRESARILREFRFIAHADVFSVEQPDGSHHIVAVTRDEWSSKFALHVRYDERIRFDGVGFVEENVAGRGITLGAYTIDRDEQKDAGVGLEVPRIGKTGWDVRLGWTHTRSGDSWDQMLVHPFRGEIGTRAIRQRITVQDNLFSYVLPEESEGGSHLVLPVRTERAELSAAWRTGSPGRWLVLGAGITRERVETGSLDDVERVRDGDFSGRDAAPAELAEPLLSQISARQATRINGLIGIRRIRYRTARGLDALAGTQDIPTGFEARLAAGRSVGRTGPERPRDTFLSGSVQAGTSTSRRTVYTHASIETRIEEPEETRSQGFRDILAEAHLFAYLQPEKLARHTFLFRASTLGGWRTGTPFQLTLGGADGVRGYGELDLPAGRRTVFTVEDRVLLPTPFPDLADIGVTLFADLGAGWAGDTPHAIDSGWRSSLGAGLRIGFPAGSSSVVRVDVAWPVGAGAAGRGPVLRISAHEWIGLLGGFQSLQLFRSRRSGLGGDYIGVAR